MTKRALVTGILGQDGAYLARLLLEKGYEVHGGYRRNSSHNVGRLEELGIAKDVHLVALEMHEFANIFRVIETLRPDETYNLAAQSFVAVSFEQPILTADIGALGTLRILESLRTLHHGCRFYQASSSEMYGKVQGSPQTELTPFYPRSPYAVAKLFAHSMTVVYREAYGMHASSGILFNHESPLRGEEFVTRKITLGLAKIRHGKQEVLELGNLDAQRDWGFSGDYVRGMWLMLQQPKGDDYVLATGKMHTVREFVAQAGKVAGFDIEWEGSGPNTRGIDRKSGRLIVRVDPQYYRPAEVDVLIGDSTKARTVLGWENTMSFSQLVETMVQADLKRVADSR